MVSCAVCRVRRLARVGRTGRVYLRCACTEGFVPTMIGSTFVAGRLVCGGYGVVAATMLFRTSGSMTFIMAHGADEIEGGDEQADQDYHEPERGAERGLGLWLSVVIRCVMMMCTVI